jgi:chemotaxis protein methyltransferase CheR
MLVLSRLSKRMRELGLQGLDAYVGYLEQNFDQEIEGLINSLSTNVTNFFRHPEHFDFLANEIRARRNAGQRRFRFWSAACSTGEEPYSIAMTALHAHEGGGADVRVLATDISTRVLDVAMRGEYLAEELAAVPRPMMRWLGVAPGRPASRAVADEVKRLIRFRHYNLSSRPLPLDGVLDAVFCRNVMIYFDRELRERLVAQAARVLRPGGLFFVGQSESLSGLRHPLRLVQPAVYQRP